METIIHKSTEELDDKQLDNNQKFIDMFYEYCDDVNYEHISAKSMMKYMWNNGYKLVKREDYVNEK